MSSTSGLTLVPSSSMLRSIGPWGSVPALYLMSKRDRPRPWAARTYFRATVSGLPANRFPAGPAEASKRIDQLKQK